MVAAVAQNPDEVYKKHCSWEQKQNPEIAKAFFSNTKNFKSEALGDLHPALKENEDFIFWVLENSKKLRIEADIVLEWAADHLRGTPEVVLKAMEKDPHSLKFATINLRNNPDFMLPLIRENPALLQWATPRIAGPLIKQNPTAMFRY